MTVFPAHKAMSGMHGLILVESVTLREKPHAGNTPSQTDLIFVAVDLQQLSIINKEHENQKRTYLKHNCKNY